MRVFNDLLVSMLFIGFICFKVDTTDIFKFNICYLVININLVDQNKRFYYYLILLQVLYPV